MVSVRTASPDALTHFRECRSSARYVRSTPGAISQAALLPTNTVTLDDKHALVFILHFCKFLPAISLPGVEALKSKTAKIVHSRGKSTHKMLCNAKIYIYIYFLLSSIRQTLGVPKLRRSAASQ